MIGKPLAFEGIIKGGYKEKPLSRKVSKYAPAVAYSEVKKIAERDQINVALSL